MESPYRDTTSTTDAPKDSTMPALGNVNVANGRLAVIDVDCTRTACTHLMGSWASSAAEPQ